MYDELLDLVDSNNEVIETLPRSEVFAQKLKNFRVVCALLKNPDGQLFIARRAFSKKDYPGYLACIGGCVQSSEQYDQALHRETLEEAMIDCAVTPYKLLGYLSPYEYPVNGYVAVYKIYVTDAKITLAEQDFCEGVWLSLEELREHRAAGEKITPNLQMILKHYYAV